MEAIQGGGEERRGKGEVFGGGGGWGWYLQTALHQPEYIPPNRANQSVETIYSKIFQTGIV